MNILNETSKEISFIWLNFPKEWRCKWKLGERRWGSVAIVYDSINGEKAADGDSWRPTEDHVQPHRKCPRGIARLYSRDRRYPQSSFWLRTEDLLEELLILNWVFFLMCTWYLNDWNLLFLSSSFKIHIYTEISIFQGE